MKKWFLLPGGLLLLFLGAYSLPMEGIPYTKTHTAKIGPFEASARTNEKINVPAYAGWALVITGVGLAWVGTCGKER